MMTEQEYNLVKKTLLNIITDSKYSSRRDKAEAAKALAELEKAYRFSSIANKGTLEVKIYNY